LIALKLRIEGKLYQLEGLYRLKITSLENNITSIDHHNHHQTFSESESDSTYCKTVDDDDDGVDNDTDYVVDVDVVDDAIGYTSTATLPLSLHRAQNTSS
jgi:hypothetical protein